MFVSSKAHLSHPKSGAGGLSSHAYICLRLPLVEQFTSYQAINVKRMLSAVLPLLQDYVKALQRSPDSDKHCAGKQNEPRGELQTSVAFKLLPQHHRPFGHCLGSLTHSP